MSGGGSTGLPQWFNVLDGHFGGSNPMMGVGMDALERAQMSQLIASQYQQRCLYSPWGLDGPNMYQLDAERALLTGAAPAGWKTRREMEEREAGLRKPIDVPDWAPLTTAQWLFLAVVVAFMGLGYACFCWGL
jgi:hypothetical protein